MKDKIKNIFSKAFVLALCIIMVKFILFVGETIANWLDEKTRMLIAGAWGGVLVLVMFMILIVVGKKGE